MPVPMCLLCFLEGYVLALEAEMQNLKHKFKTLEEQLDVLDPSKMSLSCACAQPSVLASMDTTGESPCLVLCALSSDFPVTQPKEMLQGCHPRSPTSSC